MSNPYNMTQVTLDKMMSALDETEWRTSSEVAKHCGLTQSATILNLMRMLRNSAPVECRKEPAVGGGRALNVWRKLAPGAVASIYEIPPGFDARTLDVALGGHTYRAAA